MLRITIELVPHGILSPIKIAEGTIYNNLTGNTDYGNYNFVLKDENKIYKTGVAEGHRRELNVWRLLHRVLNIAENTKHE